MAEYVATADTQWYLTHHCPLLFYKLPLPTEGHKLHLNLAKKINRTQVYMDKINYIKLSERCKLCSTEILKRIGILSHTTFVIPADDLLLEPTAERRHCWRSTCMYDVRSHALCCTTGRRQPRLCCRKSQRTSLDCGTARSTATWPVHI